MRLRLALVAALLPAALALPRAASAEPPATGAVVIAGGRASGPAADALAEQVRAALAERPGLALLPPDDEALLYRSARPRSGRRRANLDRAKGDLAAAARAFQEFDLQGAARALQRAKIELQPWVGLRSASELDRQRLQLAVALAHATRDEPKLQQALREHAARHPGVVPAKGLWPPDVVKRLEAIAGERPGVLDVRTTPRARLRVDGRDVGLSPLRLGALPAGEHRVQAIAPGYWTTEAKIETAPGREGVLDLRLAPNVSGRLRRLALDAEPPPELVQTVAELGGGRLDFAIFAATDGKTITLRRVELSKRGSGAAASSLALVRTDARAAGLRAAIGQLFEGLGPAPAAERAAVPAWAWIGGGAGVAAAGAGVVLRLLAVSTAHELEEREGALTQVEAYELRDRVDARATSGAILLGAGLAVLAGVASGLVIDLTSAPEAAPSGPALAAGGAR